MDWCECECECVRVYRVQLRGRGREGVNRESESQLPSFGPLPLTLGAWVNVQAHPEQSHAVLATLQTISAVSCLPFLFLCELQICHVRSARNMRRAPANGSIAGFKHIRDNSTISMIESQHDRPG